MVDGDATIAVQVTMTILGLTNQGREELFQYWGVMDQKLRLGGSRNVNIFLTNYGQRMIFCQLINFRSKTMVMLTH